MTVPDLAQLETILARHKPRRRWWRHWAKRSAVAIIVRDGQHGLEFLMIKRAERDGDRWSGHMAFPGGGMETDDQHGKATAERETGEEIGVDLRQTGKCIGRLSELVSKPHSGRRLMVISPFIYKVHQFPVPQPNHEVSEVLWVPLAHLADKRNRETMVWQRGSLKITLPCYYYQERQIWGLSLQMLDELLALI